MSPSLRQLSLPVIALILLAMLWLWRRLRHERQATAQLREAEARWKIALDNAGDGVYDADLTTGQSHYSHRWKAMLGHEEAEIGTDTAEWTQRIHPDDLAQVMAQERDCIAGKTNLFVGEYRMRTKAGAWVWILDRGKVVRHDAQGRGLRIIGVHTDISERKANEARQVAHAQVMTLLATGASLPQILEATVRGVETRCDWLCSIVLLDDSGSSLAPGAAPSLPDFYNQALVGLAIGPEVGSCGTAMHTGRRVVSEDLRTDPHWAPYLALAEQAGLRACWSEPILGSTGAVLGSFAAYHRQPAVPTPADIRDIIEAAQVAAIAIERKRGELALRDSEERLQRALEASRLALWDLDLDSGKVFLSDAWAQMLGGEPSVTHIGFDDLTAMVPDEDQLLISAAMHDALRGVTNGYSVEHRVRRPDGQLLWIRSQGRVIDRDAQGRARRAVGTNRNITARKEAEALRAELETQLREAQKLEAIGILAGGIAHDFNNIMAAILGNVALARQDVGEGHPAQVSLAQIRKAGQRARTLVQQILAFSRKQSAEFDGHSLRPVVEETAAMLRTLAGSSVKLSTVLSRRPLAAMANLTQLQQVLMNLGTNAWQALPGGMGHIEIGLDAVNLLHDQAHRPGNLAPGEYAHLWVRDDGCGMDDETRQHIFEPFFTTKAVGQGTGLGLAVAHGIAEAHGGAITVTTAVGQGSCFHLYLPLIDHESQPMPLDALDEPALRGQGQQVLYVDDDEVMVEMVQRLLERLGYCATCMLDALEAIALVQREPLRFDLVLTDYNMPLCSGLDVAQAMAQVRPDLPVIISSGYISDELRSSAAKLGVHSVLQKEHTFEELGTLVHAALQRS